MTPTDRKYTKTHEWVKMDGDLAVIGITDHAQHELGDITFVAPAAAGKKIAQGGECGSIESVKAASDIYAPLAGEVAAGNDALKAAPELVNQDPYGKGWIVKLKAADTAALGGLMDAAAYEASIQH